VRLHLARGFQSISYSLDFLDVDCLDLEVLFEVRFLSVCMLLNVWRWLSLKLAVTSNPLRTLNWWWCERLWSTALSPRGVRFWPDGLPGGSLYPLGLSAEGLRLLVESSNLGILAAVVVIITGCSLFIATVALSHGLPESIVISSCYS